MLDSNPRKHGNDSERIKTDFWPATCKGRRVSFNTNTGRVNSGLLRSDFNVGILSFLGHQEGSHVRVYNKIKISYSLKSR